MIPIPCEIKFPSGTGDGLLERDNGANGADHQPQDAFYYKRRPMIVRRDQTLTAVTDALWDRARIRDREPIHALNDVLGSIEVVSAESIDRIARLRRIKWKPYDRKIDDSYFE